MKKSNPTIKAQILRSAFYVLLLVDVCAIPCALAQSSFDGRTTSATPSTQTQTTLTFADRVAYQRAIEDVYWQHRIWPEENLEPKPSLDEVMSAQEIEKKVEDYLRDSQALETSWQRPIAPEQLQAEMDRMAQHTKQPDVLRELFEALGNDPFVIAECLAKPALVERTIGELSARDENLQQPFNPLLITTARAIPMVTNLSDSPYTLPEISAPDACTDNTWTATFNAPDARSGHTAVWTGSEMIVWGGSNGSALSTGGKYNPSTDTWTATSTTNAPGARRDHTAVWTGSAMIVWGGYTNSGPNYLNTGGRYNPSTDTWIATSTTGAPYARDAHTVVWTGSQMIVWGGYDGNSGGSLNTGGKYNPSTNTWTATSTTNAPVARDFHTAVWTGSEMIVWGGGLTNTGGRYNPNSDSWTATSTTNAPASRSDHTAVWTGSEMIVWGGTNDSSGGRYRPGTDTWTTTANAPASRSNHTAVWTGSEMIVWGGGSSFNSGGRYNPSTDSWTATSTTNAPDGRYDHTAVWTGTQMIVWGGVHNSTNLNTGGRYNPSTDSWTATSTMNVPAARTRHTAVWTGNQMIIWGGYVGYPNYDLNTGGRYNPSTNSWTATSTTHAPEARDSHTAIWTGSEMIVWGGVTLTSGESNTGGKYNPSTNTWTATSTTNAPQARISHTAVRAGSKMIVWGGWNGYAELDTGGQYNPSTNTWTATSTTNAAHFRRDHTAVWNGSRMIVWGGYFGLCAEDMPAGLYNPSTDTWTAASTNNAPAARYSHTAVWTGSQMIVWGGFDCHAYLNTGGRYCSQPGPHPPSAPTANPATLVTNSSFRANWSSVSGATGYRLDVSTNSSFSTYVTGYQNLNVGNVTGRNVTGLNASNTYYYRVRAYNADGTSGNSNRISVTTLTATGPPVVTTRPATFVTSYSATLNGSLNPHGLTTSVHFQYGTTTSYGHNTPMQSQTGNTYRNIFASISNLITHTTYHFRIVATNNAGTSYGSDRTFITP